MAHYAGKMWSLLILSYGLSLDLQLSRFCEVELDLISIPSSEECLILKWRIVENCKGSAQPFELFICNGTVYKTSISNVDQMEVAFSGHYCDPYCIISTNTSDVCLLFRSSKHYEQRICSYYNSIPLQESSCVFPELETYEDRTKTFDVCINANADRSIEHDECPTVFSVNSPNETNRLIQFCAYNIHAEYNGKESQYINDLKGELASACNKILNQKQTLKELVSVTTIHHPEACPLESDHGTSTDCPPKHSWIELWSVKTTHK